MGVNIILNIVHLIVFTRSDILLVHWESQELYSHEFRIDADIIVFSVFTSFFFTGFSWFLQYFKKSSFENLELRLFLQIWGGKMVFHSHDCVIILYTLFILSEISFTWIKPHGLIRQHYHFCDVNIHIAKPKYLV